MKLTRCSEWTVRLAVVAGLGCVALVAQAQNPNQAEANPSHPIIVTGSKSSPDEIRRQAIAFVRATGVAAGERPAARWAEPVCPRAIGLDARHARIVETKLRTIAGDVDIPVAHEPCRPNIAVSFVADGGGVVRKVAARSTRQLAEVPVEARETLLTGPAPVRWWYSTQTLGRDGMAAAAGQPPMAGNAEGGGSILPSGDNVFQHYQSSIVSTQAVRALTAATVVVDVNRAEGVPLDAVVAYAALVAFAEIKAGDFTPPGSILGLFEGESTPQALTDWDMTFLRTLYDLPLDRTARRHRRLLVRELAAAPGGGR